MIPVNNVLRSVYRINDTDGKFNVLSMCRNNEKYLGLLCKTPHNFYILPDHPWNVLIEQVPDNLSVLSLHSKPLDCIICYDRAEQYREAQSLAHRFHIPIILVDMCSENLIRPQHLLEGIQAANISLLYRHPDLRICNSSHIQNSWNKDSVSIVIPMGIDTDIFHSVPENEPIIALDNNISAQLGAEVARRLKEYSIIATDHDQSQPKALNRSRYFINTNQTVTVKLLEAMASENVVIAMRNPDTESFIDHEQTGILINNLDDIGPTIKHLEESQNLRVEISQNARKKILNDHSIEKFVNKWSSAFSFLKSNFYTPHR